MRSVPALIIAASFAAALVASSTASDAAPRTIDDCEKIQAADAYNQCLALFGPVAHTRGASANSEASDESGVDASPAREATSAGRAASTAQSRHRLYAHARSRHPAHKTQWTRRGHEYGHQSAHHRHSGAKRLAFNVISGHARLR